MKPWIAFLILAASFTLPAFAQPTRASCATKGAPMARPAAVDSLITAAEMAENNDGMKAADAARLEEQDLINQIEARIQRMNDLQDRVTRGDDSNGLLKLIGGTTDAMEEGLAEARKSPDLEVRLEHLRAVNATNRGMENSVMINPALREFLGEE